MAAGPALGVPAGLAVVLALHLQGYQVNLVCLHGHNAQLSCFCFAETQPVQAKQREGACAAACTRKFYEADLHFGCTLLQGVPFTDCHQTTDRQDGADLGEVGPAAQLMGKGLLPLLAGLALAVHSQPVWVGPLPVAPPQLHSQQILPRRKASSHMLHLVFTA